MTSQPLDVTHGRTTLGVACHHHLWVAHTVELRRAWHAIIAYGQHKRSNDVERDMPSPPLESTHGRTTSGVACHLHLWAAHMVERCQAWHDIATLGLHARSDDVGHGITSPPLDNTQGRQRQAWQAITALGWHIQLDDVGRGMLSSPLGITHDRTTSGVTCHHRLWTAHTVRLCGAWHDTNAFGQHTRSTDVGRGRPSSP